MNIQRVVWLYLKLYLRAIIFVGWCGLYADDDGGQRPPAAWGVVEKTTPSMGIKEH